MEPMRTSPNPSRSLGIAIRSISLTTLAGLSIPLSLHAQSYKLSGTLPPGPGGGSVRELRAAGTRVVYRADGTTFGVFELYSAPTAGGAPSVKLNGPLVAGGNVTSFRVGPPGTRVLYLADQEAEEIYELYSVSTDGSASPVRLNAALPAGRTVAAYEFSTDGSRAVYFADQTEDDRFELYSAPSDGSASAIRISGSLPPFANVLGSFLVGASGLVLYEVDAIVDGHAQLYSVPIDGSAAPLQLTQLPEAFTISSFFITPAGDRAIYVQHRGDPQRERLFSVPTDGSAAPVELSQAAVSHIESLRITPDGTRVVVRASVTGNGVYELFSAPVDGSGSVERLHPPLGTGRTVVAGSYDVTADGARVLYVADQAADDLFELWSVPSDGSASAVRLNGTLVSGGDVQGVFGVASVGAGARVVYIADQDTNGQWELFSVPADGSASAVKLNEPLAPGQGALLYSNDPDHPSLPFGADLVRAVFALRTYRGELLPALVELFSVPVDGSADPVRLNGDPAGGGLIPGAGWGFALDRVIYVADEDTAAMGELYAAPLDGGSSATKLNGPMPPAPPIADVFEERMTHDGTRVLFTADMESPGSYELYSVPADGSAGPVKLNGPLPVGLPVPPWVELFEISADDTWVVFAVRFFDFAHAKWQLFSAPVDGSGPAVQLGDWSLAGGSPFRISPDSHWVVFQQWQEDLRLFRVPIDGTERPVELLPAPPDGQRGLHSFQISPDGGRVVYLSDRKTLHVFELYSVPLHARAWKIRRADGSDRPVRLNRALAAGGDVLDFRISPDGSRVVYRADQEVDERFELFSVPIAGGAAIQVSGMLVSGGDVPASNFAISPDGSRVVYRADQLVDERFELFSAPLTGGAAIRLNGPLVAGGDVQIWDDPGETFTPDGARILYIADQEVDGRSELYIVPTVGGVAAKLSGALIPGGDVLVARLSPDGRFAVYEADQEADERFELYCRPSDGSGDPTRLSGPFAPGGSIRSFAISPDSQRVVYSADQASDGVVELFKAPLRGGPSIKLNGALVPEGDVYSFEISPDGSRVVYRADQEADLTYELFASPLVHAPGSGPRERQAPPP